MRSCETIYENTDILLLLDWTGKYSVSFLVLPSRARSRFIQFSPRRRLRRGSRSCCTGERRRERPRCSRRRPGRRRRGLAYVCTDCFFFFSFLVFFFCALTILFMLFKVKSVFFFDFFIDEVVHLDLKCSYLSLTSQ